MPPLNKETLTQKLRTLNNSQQAIEGLSSWCLFYRKEARDVVALWEREFMSAATPLKQAMLYVANHLMQESRKRGREFIDEFFKVLPRALRAGYKTGDEKIKKCMVRLIDVWDDRKVFGSAHIKTFKDIVNGDKGGGLSRRDSLDPSKHHTLRPVAEGLQYVESASSKASEAMTKSLKGVREGLVEDGTAEELRAGVEMLGQYSSALEAEIAGRKHVVSLLRALIVQQEDSIARNEENLRMCSLQREKIDRRLALLSGAGSLGVMHSAMSAPGSLALPPMGMPRPPMGPPPPGPYPPMGGYVGAGGGGGMGFDDGGMGYASQVLPPSPSAAPLGPPPLAPLPPTSIPKPQPPTTSPPTAPNGAGHHSPAGPAPDSPMPPPMSPTDAATPPFTGGPPPFTGGAPLPYTGGPPAYHEGGPQEPTASAPAGDTPMVDLNPEALAELASKLVSSSDPSVLLSVLSNLDPDEQSQLQSQVLANTGDTGTGAEEEYDPDNPY